MTKLSARTGSFNAIYWALFIFVGIVISYLLTAMIHITNAEENANGTEVVAGYKTQGAIYRELHRRSMIEIETEVAGTAQEDTTPVADQ